MSFARKVWHLLVAIKDGLSLAFLLLFFWALFAVLNARPSPAAVRDGALLLDLSGSVVEEPQNVAPLERLISAAVPTREIAARDVIHAIDAAAGDGRIKAIALDMSTFLGGGQVHMMEIGEALDRFRRSGKPVLAYAIAYTDDSMLLAAHASEVWVDPMGGVALRGPGGENLYYSGLLDRFKVKAHVFRVGTYKSAVEPYILPGMSEPARENAEDLYGSLWTEWKADVKQARPKANIDAATGDVAAWIENSGGDLAKAALDAGLVDKAGTRIEWGERVAKVSGGDDWDDSPGAFASTDLQTWLADVGPGQSGMRALTGGGKPIGVVTIAGEISDGRAGPGEAGAERIVQLLDDALGDDLAALVVRVDSPGGTVTGSEAIRRAILRHKAKGIPVAVSMANVAASGGFWVSTPADRIFAEPETITGSIGIFGVVPTFEDTLAQYGVTSDGVRTTPLSGQPDILGGFTPETEALLQSTVDFGYRRFLGLVAQSRKMPVARVDELAQGRVWDGGSARQLGLVDQFGDLDTALEWAAGQARLEKGDWHAKYLGNGPSPYQAMIAGLLGAEDGEVPAARDMMGWFSMRQGELGQRLLTDLSNLMSAKGLQARCLECPGSQPPAHRARPADGPAAFLAKLLFDPG